MLFQLIVSIALVFIGITLFLIAKVLERRQQEEAKMLFQLLVGITLLIIGITLRLIARYLERRQRGG